MERWLPVPDYKGLYEVSDLGRARQAGSGRLLEQTPFAGKPYLRVALRKEGREKTVRVHRLVLLAFVGPPAPGEIGLHGAEGPTENKLSNVYWGTASRNNGPDKARDGTTVKGAEHHEAKLTEQQVRLIRYLYVPRIVTQRDLAERFGVSPSTIHNIVRRKKWKDLR